MEAGLDSRFRGGIKQLEPVGMNGDIVMDYVIHDANEAGFNKLLFVISRDIEKDFPERIGNRVGAICEQLDVEVHYPYQNLYSVPHGWKGEKTSWGTGTRCWWRRSLFVSHL